MQSPFVAGLALGVALGGVGTFLALEKPWSDGGERTASVAVDAGPEDQADPSGKDNKKRRRRGKRNRGGGGDVELKEIDERIQLSAADRTMVWRGPKITPANKDVDFGGGGGGRTLDPGEINDGVSGGTRALSSCIAEARGQAELAASITLKFVVNPRGGIGKVRVRAPSYLLKNGLYDCAGRAIRSMDFPSTGAETVVTVPFDLSY